jgi:hypothetical protein
VIWRALRCGFVGNSLKKSAVRRSGFSYQRPVVRDSLTRAGMMSEAGFITEPSESMPATSVLKWLNAAALLV